ncbi:MAG: hypothetical protein ACRBN8_19875 [Nannocystales bacterium]
MTLRCHSCGRPVEGDRVLYFRPPCHACLVPGEGAKPVFVVRSSNGLVLSVSMDYGRPVELDDLRKHEPGATLSVEPKDRALEEFRDAMKGATDD